MDYQTYTFFCDAISEAQKLNQKEYRIAISRYSARGKTNKEVAAKAINDHLCYKEYQKRELFLINAKEQLFQAAQSHCKEKNPKNRELLTFWCVDEKEIDRLQKTAKVKTQKKKS